MDEGLATIATLKAVCPCCGSRVTAAHMKRDGSGTYGSRSAFVRIFACSYKRNAGIHSLDYSDDTLDTLEILEII